MPKILKPSCKTYYNTDQFFKLYDSFVSDSIKGKRTKKNGKKIKASTIQNYLYTRKLLVRFASEKSYDLKIFLVHKSTKSENQEAKKYWKNFFKEFTDFLYYKLDLFDNYVHQVIKCIRTFLNALLHKYQLPVGSYHQAFYVPQEEPPIIVLTTEQLNRLINNRTLEEKLPAHLRVAKDIFVFGCTVALRVSDLMKLTKQNLRIIHGSYYLQVNSLKTGAQSSIKLPPYAVDILWKYDNDMETLLPNLSTAWFNNCLKQIGRYMDLTDLLVKYRAKRGEQHIVYKNKIKKQHYTLADHISSHTMRRTGITTLLMLDVPPEVVRRISGHRPNSKEFYRYVEFAQNYLDAHTDRAFDKLLDTNAVG